MIDIVNLSPRQLPKESGVAVAVISIIAEDTRLEGWQPP